MTNKLHFVYELYAEDRTCLYVGCTSQPGSRLQWHEKNQPWAPEVVRVKLTRYDRFDAGRQAEEDLIRSLNPMHNKRFTDRPLAIAWETELLRRDEIHAQGRVCGYLRCDKCGPIRARQTPEEARENHTLNSEGNGTA